MNIKQIFFQILLSAIILELVVLLTGGLVFSKTITFVLVFFALFGAATLAAPKVRAFFLLPGGVFFDMLIHAVLLSVVFYLCHGLLGGITIKSINFPSFVFFGGTVVGTSLGVFGTIAVLAIQIAIAYQTLIWLNTEK